MIDEDGCYDPAEFNDGLVLGMKGTFAQAELHIIRARLHGGKLNKAAKGELRFALPVGLVFDDDQIVLDPDQEVRARFARSSICSPARARPTASYDASRNLGCASRAGRMAAHGTAS